MRMNKVFRSKKVQYLTVIISVIFLLLSTAYAAVQGSDHDMTITGSANFSGTFLNDNGEVCVYCHTPHSSIGLQTPLWNRSLSFPNGFTVYSSSTLDTTPTDPPSIISQLCLSCHDGVTAINSVVNGPGPGAGNITATGADQIGDLGAAARFVNIGNGDPSSPAAVDLSDDHPVSITWADRGAGFYATPQDGAIRLPGGMVECTSCHDPHNGTPPSAGEVQFLVMSNANSAMCFACHIK